MRDGARGGLLPGGGRGRGARGGGRRGAVPGTGEAVAGRDDPARCAGGGAHLRVRPVRDGAPDVVGGGRRDRDLAAAGRHGGDGGGRGTGGAGRGAGRARTAQRGPAGRYAEPPGGLSADGQRGTPYPGVA